MGYTSGMRKLLEKNLIMLSSKNNKTPGPAGPRKPESQSSPFSSLPSSSPTHVISAPPQLVEFSFGPAQLGLKVQDFVLGHSLLGDCVLLGLFHLPRRYIDGAGLPDMGNTWRGEGWATPTIWSLCQHLHIATQRSLEPQGRS